MYVWDYRYFSLGVLEYIILYLYRATVPVPWPVYSVSSSLHWRSVLDWLKAVESVILIACISLRWAKHVIQSWPCLLLTPIALSRFHFCRTPCFHLLIITSSACLPIRQGMSYSVIYCTLIEVDIAECFSLSLWGIST